MRNLSKYAVMSAMLICTLPVYGVTARDNYLYFPGVEKFGWHEAHHKITEGQPWEYIHSWYNDSTGVIHIKAGREGSEEVADWFKERAVVDGVGKAIATREDNPAGWPDKLNFATNGHMNLVDGQGRKAQCKGLVIGQGHKGLENNWWVGGEHVHEYGGKYWLVCPPAGTGYCGAVVPISTHYTHEFPLSLWMCPPAVSVSLSPDVLWSANGKMHEIEATISGGDGCGNFPVVSLVSIESSELESGTHGRDIPDDIHDELVGTDDRIFKLRAEHAGNGRVYTVTYDIVDGCAVSKTLGATVTVPQNQGKNLRLKK